MYTEAQLVSFGNYLLSRYKVKHSPFENESTKIEKEVSDADLCNWKDQNPVKEQGEIKLPSRFQQGDRAKFICMPDDPEVTTFPSIPCEILAVHFYPGKVKYDLDLLFIEDQRSRIYNVDSVLVLP